jgi:hypothetical protein
VSAPAEVTPPPANTRFLRWHRRILGIWLVIFAFELGLFLLIVPWLRTWDLNWIPLHSPLLGGFWLNPFFRGAISGLGLLNIYIAIVEAGRQLSVFFSRRSL